MIIATALCACDSVADQLDAMVLDALGAVRLLLPATGADGHLASAASAWCHDFVQRTPGAALLDLSHFGVGRIRIWIKGRAQLFELGHGAGSADYRRLPAVLTDVAVLVCDGLDTAGLAFPDELPRLIAACTRCGSLTVAPTAAAGHLMGCAALASIDVKSDALIAPDPVARERSALVGAALMHRTQQGKEQ